MPSLPKKENMRAEKKFNDNWYFYHGDIEKIPGDAKIDDYVPVRLPHDWSLDYPFDEKNETLGSGGFVEAGKGYYKKRYCIDKSIGDKRFILRFEGAYMLSSVYIDGKKLGTHVYGYTPFEFDITDFVTFGKEFVIDVMVDNSYQPNSRWYSGSGITRNVYLLEVPNCHIDSYGVYARWVKEEEGYRLLVETEVAGSSEQYSLTYDLKGNGLNVTFDEATYLLKNPCFWSPDSPSLYDLTVNLVVNGEIIDSVTVKTGVRDIKFDCNEGFVCNGVRTKLNGVCIHHDGGCLGAAVNICVWERRLKKLKEMGANAIRMAHNPPNPDLLDLCDSLGFFVMDEAFDEWNILKWKTAGSNTDNSKGYSQWFEENYRDDLSVMLKRDRNHPSIVLWSIGNEVPNQTSSEGTMVAEKLKRIVRSLDTTRPITQGCDQIVAEPVPATEEFLSCLDVVGYNYVGRWRERAETFYDEDREKYRGRCFIGTENPSVGGVRGQYKTEVEINDGWVTFPYYSTPVSVGRLLRYTMTHDFVSGDFMWTGVDYLGEAQWPRKNASSGALDTCGFEKDSFFFYKSIFDRKNPMVHLLPHWNIEVEKGTVIPVLCYTNCEWAELFVNGKSFGKKAYSYPAYGMTEKYGHFNVPPIPVCTDNLFLSWDVPYEPGEVIVKGYIGDKECASQSVKTSKKASQFGVAVYSHRISIENDDVAMLEVSLMDEDGVFCPNGCNHVTVLAENGTVIGCDNGNPTSLSAMHSNQIDAFSGKAFFVIRPGDKGILKIKVRAFDTEKEILVEVV